LKFEGCDEIMTGSTKLRPQCGHNLEFDHFLAPFAGGQAIVDVFTNIPIKLDKLLVCGRNNFLLGRSDQSENFGELGL
jgi:hypothetical protein